MNKEQMIEKIMKEIHHECKLYINSEVPILSIERIREILNKHLQDLESLKEEKKEVEIKSNRYEMWWWVPKWVWYDDNWKEHIDDYVHQDWYYDNLCTQSKWCRCSE